MSGTRDLTGLVGRPPSRTVAAPPRRQTSQRDRSSAEGRPAATTPSDAAEALGAESGRSRRRRTESQHDDLSATPSGGANRPAPSTTVRISVNIPLGCKQWLARQARKQQRFVSEIVMEALDRHGDEVHPPSGRAKRVAVPDGTIYNVVLPTHDKQRLDEVVARKKTTRSALLSEILRRAVDM